MLIKSIKLQGFKCFTHEKTVTLEPCNFFVIAGLNGTGKTSLINAIELFFDASYADSHLALSCRSNYWQGMSFVELEMRNVLPVEGDTIRVKRVLNQRYVDRVIVNSRHNIDIKMWYRLLGDLGCVQRPYKAINLDSQNLTRWLRKSYDQNIAEVYNEMKKSNDKRKKMERDYITTCNMIQTQTRLDRQISYLASKKKRYTNLLAKKKQVWLNWEIDLNYLNDSIDRAVNKNIDFISYVHSGETILTDCKSYRSEVQDIISEMRVRQPTQYKNDVAYLFKSEIKTINNFKQLSETSLALDAKRFNTIAQQQIILNKMVWVSSGSSLPDLTFISAAKVEFKRIYKDANRLLVRKRWCLAKEQVLKASLVGSWKQNSIYKLALNISYACQDKIQSKLKICECDRELWYATYRTQTCESKLQCILEDILKTMIYDRAAVESLRQMDRMLVESTSEIRTDFCGYLFDFVIPLDNEIQTRIKDVLLIGIFRTQTVMIQFMRSMMSNVGYCPPLFALDALRPSRQINSTSWELLNNCKIQSEDPLIQRAVKCIINQNILENKSVVFSEKDDIGSDDNELRKTRLSKIWYQFITIRNSRDKYIQRKEKASELRPTNKKILLDSEHIIENCMNMVPKIVDKLGVSLIKYSENILKLQEEIFRLKTKSVEASTFVTMFNTYITAVEEGLTTNSMTYEQLNAHQRDLQCKRDVLEQDSYRNSMKIEKNIQMMQEMVWGYTEIHLKSTKLVSGFNIFKLEPELAIQLQNRLLKLDDDYLEFIEFASSSLDDYKVAIENSNENISSLKLEQRQLENKLRSLPDELRRMTNDIVTEQYVFYDNFGNDDEFDNNPYDLCKEILYIDIKLAQLRTYANDRNLENFTQMQENLDKSYESLRHIFIMEHNALVIRTIKLEDDCNHFFINFSEEFSRICSKILPGFKVHLFYLQPFDDLDITAPDYSSVIGIDLQVECTQSGMISAPLLSQSLQTVLQVALQITAATLQQFPVIYWDNMLEVLEDKFIKLLQQLLRELPDIQSFFSSHDILGNSNDRILLESGRILFSHAGNV